VKSTKFLFAIAVGVVILVAALLISALLYFERFQYQADDTPEGVVHNYLLALRRQDYKRAYGYLWPSLRGYPADLDQFAADAVRLEADVNRPPYDFNWYKEDASLTVKSVEILDDYARVDVTRTKLHAGGLFDNGQNSYTFLVSLQRLDGAWKISWAEWYWYSCWSSPGIPGCR